ncbi:MAG TPA: DUF4340 domain-containing protein [Candidatus Krumholzibacteria bacterium]|nr:DUF4340 domain-containing protein [Candidatus Krumholzibacteria bacterium]
MPKSKNLVILAAVVAVLAIVSVLQKTSHHRTTSRPSTAVLLEGTWSGDNVARIALGLGEEPDIVVLEKGPDGWIVPSCWNARASRTKIDGLLKVLSGLQGEFRSDREDVLADYGLGPADAVTIRVRDAQGAEVASLDVGTAPAGARGQFVRRPGSNAVYVSGTGVLAPLGLYGGPARPSARTFLDLQAVQDERNDVDRIELVDEHGARTLAKVFAAAPAAGDSAGAGGVDRLTWEWTLSGDTSGPAAKTKADGVLGAAVSIRAVDVDDPAGDPALYGLDAPARVATVVFADGHTRRLAFGNERPADGDKPAGVWLRVDDDPTVWVATAYAANNLFKAGADLLPTP